jgi:8-oxo-dGTP pyrophosphatase MutT (NUDIX family)
MISFTAGGTQFQLRAAALVCHQGRVLLHQAVGDAFWTLPGGRVEAGEDTTAAVRRELLEELGEPVQALQLRYVVESFYPHDGRHCHELGFFYRCELMPGSTLGRRAHAFAGREQHLPKPISFAWFGPAERAALQVYPAFLRTAELDGALGGPQHVVERG